MRFFVHEAKSPDPSSLRLGIKIIHMESTKGEPGEVWCGAENKVKDLTLATQEDRTFPDSMDSDQPYWIPVLCRQCLRLSGESPAKLMEVVPREKWTLRKRRSKPHGD